MKINSSPTVSQSRRTVSVPAVPAIRCLATTSRRSSPTKPYPVARSQACCLLSVAPIRWLAEGQIKSAVRCPFLPSVDPPSLSEDQALPSTTLYPLVKSAVHWPFLLSVGSPSLILVVRPVAVQFKFYRCPSIVFQTPAEDSALGPAIRRFLPAFGVGLPTVFLPGLWRVTTCVRRSLWSFDCPIYAPMVTRDLDKRNKMSWMQTADPAQEIHLVRSI